MLLEFKAHRATKALVVFREIRGYRVSKAILETKDSKEPTRALKATKASKVLEVVRKALRAHRVSRASKEPTQVRKATKDFKAYKDSKVSKDHRAFKGRKDSKGHRATKEIKGIKETKELLRPAFRDRRAAKEIRETKGARVRASQMFLFLHSPTHLEQPLQGLLDSHQYLLYIAEVLYKTVVVGQTLLLSVLRQELAGAHEPPV